jgi:hypothetical protein
MISVCDALGFVALFTLHSVDLATDVRSPRRQQLRRLMRTVRILKDSYCSSPCLHNVSGPPGGICLG